MRIMRRRSAIFALTALAAAGFYGPPGSAQTPEQQQMWDAQRAQAKADEQAKQERLAKERERRKADPMGWVRTLDPLTQGGWEFRAVASDGSWATYGTMHQMKRSGKLVTVWLRHEFAEPQSGSDGKYLSVVQKVQYDCGKQRSRTLLVVYYADNNIQGSEQSEESDPKTAPWTSIVPGTREEHDSSWACDLGK